MVRRLLMKTTAALLIELARPLELVDLEIPALKPGQVLIEVAFSGVCHTQVLEARGHRGPDRFLPHCLGHEGSGIVAETGSAAAKVKEGDRVILSWIKGSGADVSSVQYGWNGSKVNAGAITTFGRHAVISENRLTPCPRRLRFPKGPPGSRCPPAGSALSLTRLSRGQARVLSSSASAAWASVPIAAAAISGLRAGYRRRPAPGEARTGQDIGRDFIAFVPTSPIRSRRSRSSARAGRISPLK